MNKNYFTIIILTKNAGPGFKSVLDGVFSQNRKPFETIIIDSGSTDATLEIAKQFPVKIVQIRSSEFGHGKTRNLGAKLAKGKYLVFLTHDAIPMNMSWLDEILAPFEDKMVAAVYGRQVPRKDENLLDKLFFLSLYGDRKIKWTEGSYTAGDNIFSDANSAIRKDLLITNPYKNDIIVSEDYEWANRIIGKGYQVVYQPKAKVIHSHSYNLVSLFKRNFDIGVSYKYISGFTENGNFLKKGLKLLGNEVKYLVKKKRYALIPSVIIRDGIRFIAINLGKSESLFPKNFKKRYLSAQRWYWI
jgi:rhamnosyltransferase